MKTMRSISFGAIVAVLAVSATLTSAWGAEPTAKIEYPTKPFLKELKIEASLPVQELATKLAIAWGKELSLVVNTTFPVDIKPPAEVIKDISANMAEVAILSRGTSFSEEWEFIKHLARPPVQEVIGYDFDKQPIYVVVDPVKKDRWISFIKWCQSDAAQQIVRETGFMPIHHDKRT
jgi:ABC-type phosphate transport system substrate-binding protein